MANLLWTRFILTNLSAGECVKVSKRMLRAIALASNGKSRFYDPQMDYSVKSVSQLRTYATRDILPPLFFNSPKRI